jgi:hypothetical protein
MFATVTLRTTNLFRNEFSVASVPNYFMQIILESLEIVG